MTSGGYGHRVGRRSPTPTCPPSVQEDDRVEVGLFGRWIGARVAAEPLYDPKMERVRA